MSQEFYKKEYKFENLYSLDKNNKIKEWTIKVIDMNSYSLIIYTYGYITEQKTECKITINKETHYKQALFDAILKWNKKRYNDNYVTELENLYDELYNSRFTK